MKEHVDYDFFGYSLADLIHTFPELAHLKDAIKYQYQISNQRNLDVFGCKNEEELRGKDVFDLEEIMGANWPSGFAQKIHEQDKDTVKTKTPIYSKGVIYLNKSGHVVNHSIMKIPTFDVNRKVIGILTLSFDATKSESIENIRNHYKNLYKNKNIANLKFMEHIRFDAGINSGVTDRELDCLVSLIHNRSVKEVAADLNISFKTVETHLTHVREKLNCPNLSQLIKNFLANYYK